MPAIGVLRDESWRGWSDGMFSICRPRSGDALISHQLWEPSESSLRAILDWLCGLMFPVRAATQLAQAQFHCGKPPPAALPRMWMRINRSFRGDSLFDQTEPA